MATIPATDGNAKSLANSASPAVIKIFVERVGAGARGEQYRVTHAGIELIAKTHNPFFDSSRALNDIGVTGILEMWHVGATYPSLRGDIQRCAKLTVIENGKIGPKIGYWQPFDTQRGAGMPFADSALAQASRNQPPPFPT